MINSELKIENYEYIRCDSMNRYTGGVMIYVKNNCKFRNRVIEKKEGNYWMLSVWLECDSFKGYIYVLYHSPGSSDAEFLNYIDNLCESLNFNSNYVFIGDFNIDFNKKTYYSDKLNYIMESRGLIQRINEATRVTDNSKTLIDLLFTNLDIKVEVLNVPRITDHNIVEMKFRKKSELEQKNYKLIECRNFKNFDTNFLKNILAEEMSTLLNNDLNLNINVNDYSNTFINIVTNALNVVCPYEKRKILLKWVNNKWYDDEIRYVSRLRDTSYERAIFTRQDIDWTNYKYLRNKTVKMIDVKRKSYLCNEINENKGNTKELWRIIKEIVNENYEIRINNIDFGGKIITYENTETISKEFNLYFRNSIEDLVNDINNSGNALIFNNVIEKEYINDDNKWTNNKLEFFDMIDENTLNKIIMNIKVGKSKENKLFLEIIKNNFDLVKNSLITLINKSLIEGFFPEKWKVSTIVPIPKISGTNKATNFRPINTLPVYEKILETVVKNNIVKYLEGYDLLIDEQAAYREKYSCEIALQEIIDDWKKTISKNKLVGVIFLDLKRAFEIVDRKILLIKLRKYGIQNKVYEWFETYLTERKQRVKFENSVSEELCIDYGVPQGSVLGPILFIVFINDIRKYLTEICKLNCRVQLFADDTVVYVEGDSSEDIEDKLNKILEAIEKWLYVNKLLLNINKTKFMILKNKRKVTNRIINILNSQKFKIEQVKEIKYLGVIIDENLYFKKYAEYIIKKTISY